MSSQFPAAGPRRAHVVVWIFFFYRSLVAVSTYRAFYPPIDSAVSHCWRDVLLDCGRFGRERRNSARKHSSVCRTTPFFGRVHTLHTVEMRDDDKTKVGAIVPSRRGKLRNFFFAVDVVATRPRTAYPVMIFHGALAANRVLHRYTAAWYPPTLWYLFGSRYT